MYFNLPALQVALYMDMVRQLLDYANAIAYRERCVCVRSKYISLKEKPDAIFSWVRY